MATLSRSGAMNVQLVGNTQHDATYFATGLGYTAYATPTDMLTLSGVAGKLIRVIQLRMLARSTSGTLVTFSFVKRSTPNTGGTATQPTGFAMDSGDSAHSAVINLYTAAPTLGTEVGRQYQIGLTTALTGAPAIFTANIVASTSSVTLQKPIVLRENESLCANFDSAALPAGFSSGWDIMWTEANL